MIMSSWTHKHDKLISNGFDICVEVTVFLRPGLYHKYLYLQQKKEYNFSRYHQKQTKTIKLAAE